MLPTNAGHNIHIIAEIVANKERGGVIAIRTVDEFIVALDFNALEIGLCHEVGNTGDSIRSVNRCRTVFQNFDSIEREKRDGVGITKAAADCARRG
ncbi:MAG: hypothetical protein ABJ307_11785 [Lentilitoribacter sp.]